MIFSIPYKLFKRLDAEDIAKIGVLKSAYVNGIIYDYTPAKLRASLQAKGIIVSERKLQAWVGRLVRLGYCKMSHGNLKVLRVKPAKKHYRVSVTFSSYKELLAKVYLELLKNKSRQSYFADNFSEFVGRNVSFKHSKVSSGLTKRFKQTQKHVPSTPRSLSISYDGLCVVFNTNRSKAYRIVEDLLRLNLLAKQKHLSNLGFGSIKTLKNMKIQGVFTFKGTIYKREINEYHFL
jgi:hypothetical protein